LNGLGTLRRAGAVSLVALRLFSVAHRDRRERQRVGPAFKRFNGVRFLEKGAEAVAFFKESDLSLVLLSRSRGAWWRDLSAGPSKIF
jgi:hypothetical protein